MFNALLQRLQRAFSRDGRTDIQESHPAVTVERMAAAPDVVHLVTLGRHGLHAQVLWAENLISDRDNLTTERDCLRRALQSFRKAYPDAPQPSTTACEDLPGWMC